MNSYLRTLKVSGKETSNVWTLSLNSFHPEELSCLIPSNPNEPFFTNFGSEPIFPMEVLVRINVNDRGKALEQLTRIAQQKRYEFVSNLS